MLSTDFTCPSLSGLGKLPVAIRCCVYHSRFHHSIIGSLAGTSYYGPVAGHGFISHDLDLVREERRKIARARSTTVEGPVEAVADKEGERFVRIRKRDVEHEQEKN